MFDKMKELMEMKKQADQIKKELDGLVIEYTDVRNVKIVINGSQDIKSVEIEESFINPANKKRLEADVMRAFNGAIKKSQHAAAQRMKNLMPGGFPGL
jgi:DNA-binding YbaB/EbfC family protein